MLGLMALLIPATASAAAPRAMPPGVSGANQYIETLPGPAGNVPTESLGGEGRGKRTPAQVLGRSEAAQLEALGPDGRAAARLAAATAPGRGDGRAGGREATNPSGASPVNQIVGQVSGTSGSGGMGLLLPALIASAAVAAAAYALGRRRAAHGHQ